MKQVDNETGGAAFHTKEENRRGIMLTFNSKAAAHI
jgi:hypothetical protein